jgi:hypothetical protein
MYDEATLREVKRRLLDGGTDRRENYEATLAWINVQLGTVPKRMTPAAPKVPKRWDVYDD